MKNKILQNTKKWYKRRNRVEKTLLWFFLGLLLVAFIFNAGVQAWNGYHGLNINQNDCVKIGTEVALMNASNSYWQIVLIDFLPTIKLLIILIGIAWIVHGVQFRILA